MFASTRFQITQWSTSGLPSLKCEDLSVLTHTWEEFAGNYVWHVAYHEQAGRLHQAEREQDKNYFCNIWSQWIVVSHDINKNNVDSVSWRNSFYYLICKVVALANFKDCFFSWKDKYDPLWLLRIKKKKKKRLQYWLSLDHPKWKWCNSR